MSLKEYTFEGFSQYRAPFCSELKGKELSFVMDNGKEYAAVFKTGHSLSWGVTGEPQKVEKYDCLKVDDQVYLVNVELSNMRPRTGITLGIDFENMLVTCIKAWHDEEGPNAYLTETQVIFGAIARADGSVSSQRHSYTDDLAGKAIRWTYGPDFSILHTYPNERQCSVHLVNHEDYVNEPIVKAIIDPKGQIPWTYDLADTTDWIKLKEGIYMLTMVEACYPQILNYPRLNCLSFCFNLKRMHNFGRYFGYNEKYERENYMYSAYGKYMNMEPLDPAREHPVPRDIRV
jgi:hypothetical protein